jgi:cell division septum initiation protein DivIVA
MAERWARLLEAENTLAVSQKKAVQPPNDHLAEPTPSITSEPPTDVHAALVADAQTEAQQIIARANQEARRIREDAMHLLAVAEGEKAESREIAMSETQRAAHEAEILRAEAEEEAKRLREQAERLAADSDADAGAHSKRKLPRIGDSANSLLSEMSGLRAKLTDEEDRQAG